MKKTKLLVLFIAVLACFMVESRVEAKTELPFPIHVIQKNAPDNESNVIVFFGDGFTKDQQGKFVEEARKKAAVLMDIEPFKMQKESFNIYAMQVVSNEEGAGTIGGSTSPDTYFSTKYNYGGIDRLLYFTGNGYNKASALFNEIQNSYLDKGGVIFHASVITNSLKYGGSGGYISVTSLSSGTSTMILHEAAHGFAGLRDEYFMANQGEGPNKTKNNDLATIKWKEFVGFRGVGAYAYGVSSDGATWYKPIKSGCLMETLYSTSFCEVCKHEVFSKINVPRIKIYKDIYVATPIFTIENTNTEFVNGLSLKDNNVDLKTVIHNYSTTAKTMQLQIKIKEGDTVINTIEEDIVIPANTLKSVQKKIAAIATANANYKLEINIFDKEKNELISTNTDALKKAEVSYSSYLGNGINNTTTQLVDVDKYSATAVIGRKINPVGPKINGYTYRGSNVPTGGILVSEVNKPVNFYYTKNEGILHLIYKDVDGNITGTQDKKIAYGETFNPQQSDVTQIENYDVIFSNSVTYNGIEDVTVTYQYKKQSKEVWIKAVDKSTGAMIAKISLGQKQIGKKIAVKAPTANEISELKNYELTDAKEKQVQLANNKTDETITFFYNKKKVDSQKSEISEGTSNIKLETGKKQTDKRNITLTNPEFNIKLIFKNSSVTEDYELIVKKHDENILVGNKKLNEMFTKYIAYDLKLKKGEQFIELTDQVTVKIPIPTGYNKENIKIYYVNDSGSKVEVMSYLEKDYISFETNKLTTFIVSEANEEKSAVIKSENKKEEVKDSKGNINYILYGTGSLCLIVIAILIIKNK